MLQTPLGQLADIIEKAREFDAETAPVDSDSGSNPSDDHEEALTALRYSIADYEKSARDR